MKTKKLPLEVVQENRNNPRIISDAKFEKLVDSILTFPKMLEIRPVVIDKDNVAIGGNRRHGALQRIASMTKEAIVDRLGGVRDFSDMTDKEQKVLVGHWSAWLKKPTVTVVDGDELTEQERTKFIILDNVSSGDWDWAQLENWNSEQLEGWGVSYEMPDFGGMPFDESNPDGGRKKTETERLSEVKFTDCYYTPVEKPSIKLEDCIDLELFNKKVDVINNSELPQELKETMKMLAYRFIKIDFENIANYYAFNATEEEKRVIERLRCVLVDGAIDGFFEDRMLRVNEHFNEESND